MQDNLTQLKEKLKQSNIDYFLLPNNDEFGSEYLPEYAKRLEFMTGFTGSNAFVIISTKDNVKSAFFTDGRYLLQAAKEIDQTEFEIFDLSKKLPLKWLFKNVNKKRKIGLDGRLHSICEITNYQQFFTKNLIFFDDNPIDELWSNQPAQPEGKVFDHQIKFCGQNKEQKIKEITAKMNNKADAMILTDPASICWLFNIRGNDINYSPLVLTYAIIYKNGNSILFKKDDLPKNLFKKQQKYSIQLDFNQANYHLYQTLRKYHLHIINSPNPCLPLKSIKNSTEIKGAIKAHIIDGLAVSKFLFWLKNSIKENKEIDELMAAEKLLQLRQENNNFCYPSFATIAGFAENGAIIHYQTNEKTNKKLSGNSLFLIDSGGQYPFGTTDITRTIAIGQPNEEMIENFTRVLKGHINIARAKFPIGTTGADLDILARYNLWQKGLDYAHGTGHGVGSFSSVHESPPTISKKSGNVELKAGMILSNEPGFYQEDQYGIRIENLILVENHPEIENFLQFKTLSLAPIDPHLIDFKMLTRPEKKWLFDYHQEIHQNLESNLGEEEKKWLKEILGIYEKVIN